MPLKRRGDARRKKVPPSTTATRVLLPAPPSRIPWRLWLIVFAVAAVIAGGELYLIKSSQYRKTKALPILAKVPDFALISEMHLSVTNETFAGHIWVADFIFTRCNGPCPMMTERMKQLQVATRNLANGHVRLVSVTVDPAYDTPDVLSRYGAAYGTNPDRWSFLTGNPQDVEKFISKGMLLGLSKDKEGMPVHTQKFVLVDRFGFIRGYYDAGDKALIQRLVTDIGTLDREREPPKQP